MRGEKPQKVLQLVGKRSAVSQDSMTLPEKIAFGQKPWDVKAMVPVDAHESWLRYQAQSILKRPVTKAEAEELFERIDIHTREPKVAAEKLSPWQEYLRWWIA